MEKFTKTTARDFVDILREDLKNFGDKYGIAINLGSGRFTETTLTLKVICTIKDDTGALKVSDSQNAIADSYAKTNDISFSGHIIGSVWTVKEDYYVISRFETKNRKYPFILTDVEGNTTKCGIGFIRAGKQITFPETKDFVTWAVTDPDDDAVRESDVEICDNVNAYFTLTMDKKNQDIFFGIINDVMENTKLTDTKLKDLLVEVHHLLSAGTTLKEIDKYVQSNL